MRTEQALSIRILLDSSSQPRSASISSSRQPGLSALFVGHSPQQAQSNLPLLYNLCAAAQSAACACACDSAQGISPNTDLQLSRNLSVVLENIKEHAWRVLMDWPRACNALPAQQAMADLMRRRRQLVQLLDIGSIGSTDWLFEVRGLAEILSEYILGQPAQTWLDVDGMQGFHAWLGYGDGLAQRTMRHLLKSGWAEVGQSGTLPLPQMEGAQLAQAMLDSDFLMNPTWDGLPRETGCNTRQDSMLLEALRLRHGNGLLHRSVARLTELARHLQQLAKPDSCPPMIRLAAPGLALVETARGLLAHSVQINQGRISSYRILAPTEWNFHPQGVLAEGLAALRGEPADILAQAGLLIEAIDPCVAYFLEIG